MQAEVSLWDPDIQVHGGMRGRGQLQAGDEDALVLVGRDEGVLPVLAFTFAILMLKKISLNYTTVFNLYKYMQLKDGSSSAATKHTAIKYYRIYCTVILPDKETHIHTEGDVDGQVTIVDLRGGNDVLLQDVEYAREHVVVHAARTGTCRREAINRHQQTRGKMTRREAIILFEGKNARYASG